MLILTWQLTKMISFILGKFIFVLGNTFMETFYEIHEMKPTNAKTIFIEVTAALFVLLFIYTAIMKLRDIPFFIGSMNHSPILRPYAPFLSVYIPSVELIIAILLILPFTRYAGLVCASLLMLIFTAYIAYILLYSDQLPCSCGGVIQQMKWPAHLIFNILFLLMGTSSIVLKNQLIAINRSSRTPEI